MVQQALPHRPLPRSKFRVLAHVESVPKTVDGARQIGLPAFRGPAIFCQFANLFGPADFLPVSMAIAPGMAVWTILQRLSR